MKFEPGFESKGLSTRPQRASSAASHSHKILETAASPTEFSDNFCLRPSIVIEICSALRSPYPAGDGSAATFRRMPANSRRVR